MVNLTQQALDNVNNIKIQIDELSHKLKSCPTDKSFKIIMGIELLKVDLESAKYMYEHCRKNYIVENM